MVTEYPLQTLKAVYFSLPPSRPAAWSRGEYTLDFSSPALVAFLFFRSPLLLIRVYISLREAPNHLLAAAPLFPPAPAS